MSQANDNSAKATFGGSQADISADADGDVILAEPIVAVPVLALEEGVDPGIEQIDGLDLALQGQLVGQVNLNVQRGASIATAISDDVTVVRFGSVTAWMAMALLPRRLRSRRHLWCRRRRRATRTALKRRLAARSLASWQQRPTT